MSWSIQDKMATVFSAVVLIIVLLSLTTYRNAYHLIDANRLVTHTHEVQEDLEAILSLIKDAETGQRGFLLTGNDLYLEPYHNSTALVEQTLQHVEKLVADNPAQTQSVHILKPLVSSKLQELDQTIRLRRAEGFQASLEIVRRGSGKESMDQIRRLIGAMRSTEATLLYKRIERVELENGITTFTIIVATLLNFLLLALGYYTITKHLRERREYETTINKLSRKLDQRTDQPGPINAAVYPDP